MTTFATPESFSYKAADWVFGTPWYVPAAISFMLAVAWIWYFRRAVTMLSAPSEVIPANRALPIYDETTRKNTIGVGAETSALNIGVAAFGQYETTAPLSNGRVRRTVYIVVRNLGSTPIHGIMVYVEKKGRRAFSGTDVLPLIEDEITLAPKSSCPILLATRDETDDPDAIIQDGDNAVLCIPERWGGAAPFWGIIIVRVSARATSGEASSAILKVSTNHVGRLCVNIAEDDPNP
jgi:hypothetical protein